MKVFKVYPDFVGYDNFNFCIVVANNKNEVRNMLKYDKKAKSTRVECNNNYSEFSQIWFSDEQGTVHIDEIDMGSNEPYISCSSFYAG